MANCDLVESSDRLSKFVLCFRYWKWLKCCLQAKPEDLTQVSTKVFGYFGNVHLILAGLQSAMVGVKKTLEECNAKINLKKRKSQGFRPGVECKVVRKVYKVDMKNWDVVQQMSYPIHARALLNHAIGFIGSLAISVDFSNDV